MSTTRVMPGIVDQTGTKVNTLRVGEMVSRHPRPRYRTTCETCGSQSTESHDRIKSGAARCLASNCGKVAQPKRDHLDDDRRAAAQREDARLAEDRAASLRRMEFETDGHEVRKSRPPVVESPMSERDRISLREFREAEEAARRAADAPRLEAERKQAKRIAELQSEYENNTRKLQSTIRERVTTGKDEAFQIDPETTKPIPTAQVEQWHKEQMAKFLADNPTYFPCRENEDAMVGYLDRNAPDLKLVSAAQLTSAYTRLKEFGLLKERPAPVPAPMVRSTPVKVNLTITPETPTQPTDGLVDGWDLVSGEPRKWTQRELDHLSADQYRRALRLYKAALSLPNAGPGPVGRR
jgi:hypothetical protein